MVDIVLDDSIKSNALQSKMGKQKWTTNVNILNLDIDFDYIVINCGYALRLSQERINEVCEDNGYDVDDIPFKLLFLSGTYYKYYHMHHKFIDRIIEYEDGAKELYEKLIGSTKLNFDTLFKKNVGEVELNYLKNSNKYKKATDLKKMKMIKNLHSLKWWDFAAISEILMKCNHCGCFNWGNMYGVKIITVDNMRILSVGFDTESG